jgi:hypothetical protein
MTREPPGGEPDAARTDRRRARRAAPATLLVASAVATASAFACTDLKVSGSADAGSEDVVGADDGSGGAPEPRDGSTGSSSGGSSSGGSSSGGSSSGGSSSGGSSSGGSSSGGVGPSAPCRPIPLACLDASPSNVIEVPTESTLPDAITSAKAGDVVQVRGPLSLGAGWRVPPYVTLRGCNGAKIVGSIGFMGSAGTIEGFEVSGSIFVNQTGSYVVRYDHFTGGGPTPAESGVSGQSVDALVSASVTLVVESNRFDDRPYGIDASAAYDTGNHAVDVTVRNNVFAHVAEPFRASRSGLAAAVTAKLEYNTFYDFTTAVRLTGLTSTTTTSGNLFAHGDKGVQGATYEVTYSAAWDVTTPAATPPLSGAFATGDPAFVDADAGDLRLGKTSAVLDVVPSATNVPAEDYNGCPRPAGAVGGQPKADVGAFESQP